MEIVRFWGFGSEAGIIVPQLESQGRASATDWALSDAARSEDKAVGAGARVLGVLKARAPVDVETLIAKALRAAGLLS